MHLVVLGIATVGVTFPITADDTGGVRLGLPAVRAIVLEQGGSVTLANRPGGGLEVKVSLPVG